MRLPARLAALALAALLTLVLALARYRNGAGASRTAPGLLVPPPAAADVPLKDMRSAQEVLAAQWIGNKADPAKGRRPRLRDKGEALGGGTPDQAGKSTGTASRL